ncbi:hypothetical protein PYR71_24260 [Rhizobium sp. MC63]|uniref:Uncharacterized protein n=2 Tax=Rhizobium TaxID=379 RepID=A0A7W8UQ49_9HYPH|nr:MULTISPECIES: hypothetical protein [Rhizobium]MBB4574639.1 hypothetical protein [Rhizobium lentis]MBB5550566.1 hypothetical protein [Rhizobium lentis]MBB5561312.1 hypothetical protein [Rhizobium lentis]MBB5567685.1 hypothetical protein [Rhizobium lentis]MDF0699549.1 hypothetical protein [Rhizobium sp. MC63]
MQHIESLKNVETKPVWSVKDFAKRHHLNDIEEARLLQLFGPFATASELLHNAERAPRWR